MMKKIALLSIIMAISMGVAGCNNSAVPNDNNQTTNPGTTNPGTTNSQSSNETGAIAIEEAKDIALNDAKLTRDNVTFIKAKKELDNGVEKYDIEFYSGNTEYNYEINAANGKIMEYNHDIKDFDIKNNQNSNNTAKITLEEAKNIAIKHANLLGKKVTFIKAERDLEDGVEVYELEFLYGNIKYDYEINATDGKIIGYTH
ncbi:MAG: PepSY domain-containing protein [Inconstantimicrobium porci]|uniref:PepSY domain-containing protein n=1 Tax=Inconstantimicrobium porci TaxID=2652291 RepID=UPI002A90F7E9|nr:PepSY domain-containing protein [Inconstantimicrobium porci]MDY5912089.1 PepSY domain-containing protein [Inconstantimicrobium porci]